MVYSWPMPNLAPFFVAYSLSFIALLAGSLTDLKTREVPDWVNYGLIISGVGLNLLFSVIYSTPSYIISSIIGLVIFFVIAYMMFYLGQWGGGDSKMLMGLGSMIGIEANLNLNQFLLAFLVNSLFIGAVYGMAWSFALAFRNKAKFSREFKKILGNKPIILIKRLFVAYLVILIFLLFLVKNFYFRVFMLSLTFLILTTFYLWIFVKAIEKSCMHKLVEPSRLTEGDWIVKNIYVNGKYVTGPKDLGISKSKIRRLIGFYRRKKVRKILIKEGIPFVPSFFLAFLATLIYGNLLWFLSL